MKKAIAAGLAGLMALGTLASPAAAQISGAQIAAPVAAISGNANSVEDVQYRRYRGDRYYGDRRHYRGDRRYYRRDRSNVGVGVAAGVLGLAAGAAIAGSANANNARSSDAVQYCINRFRSYDVRSGTYLGYDGRRHACP